MKISGRGRFHRGVLLLPSLFTLGNLFCGLFALRATADWPVHGPQHLERAAVFVIIAIVLDGLDGRIARLAHATSPLGMQLDSLADVVSFGVAPALLVYSWALSGLGNIGWAVALLFAACGALRLARFNVQSADPTPSRDFQGLPIPAAAGAVAAVVFLRAEPVTDEWPRLAVAAGTLLLSLLMVSTVRYPSFKQLDVRRRQPLRTLLWIVVVFVVVSSEPQVALAAAAALYVLSGPAGRLAHLVRSSSRGDSAEVTATVERTDDPATTGDR